MRNYPDIIDAFMEYTQYVEAPEKFLRWSIVSAVAGALERRVWIDFKGQKHCYPNMYTILVGPPGLVRKSTSSSMAFELLRPIEDLRFLATQFTPAALILQIQKSGQGRFFEWDGKSFNNSSVFIYSSEAINTLKQSEGQVVQLLTDLYDCGPDGWNEGICWSKETKGDGRIEIFNPCINFLGCSVPDWLVKSIGEEDLKSGFASRLLMVVHTTRPKRDFGWDEEVPSMRHMKQKLTEDLRSVSILKGPYKPTQDFKELFTTIDRDNKKFLERNPNETMFGYFARKPWHLLKLSQVLQASSSDEMTINAAMLQKAKDLIETLELEMKEAFGDVGKSKEAKNAEDIWQEIKEIEHPFTKRDLMGKFFDKEAKEILEAIARLKDMGRIKAEPINGNVQYQVVLSEPL